MCRDTGTPWGHRDMQIWAQENWHRGTGEEDVGPGESLGQGTVGLWGHREGWPCGIGSAGGWWPWSGDLDGGQGLMEVARGWWQWLGDVDGTRVVAKSGGGE